MRVVLCVTFFAIIIGVQALTPDQVEKLEKTSKACQEETGVSRELILKARNNDFVEDRKLKEQVLCLSKKGGLVDNSDEIDIQELKNKLRKAGETDTEIDKIINKCVTEKEATLKNMFKVFKCVYDASERKFSPAD